MVAEAAQQRLLHIYQNDIRPLEEAFQFADLNRDAISGLFSFFFSLSLHSFNIYFKNIFMIIALFVSLHIYLLPPISKADP